jgi:hypothetical protein
MSAAQVDASPAGRALGGRHRHGKGGDKGTGGRRGGRKGEGPDKGEDSSFSYSFSYSYDPGTCDCCYVCDNPIVYDLNEAEIFGPAWSVPFSTFGGPTTGPPAPGTIVRGVPLLRVLPLSATS